MNKKYVQINNDRNSLLQETLDYAQGQELDDDQLQKIQNFKNLEIYEQTLIIMRSEGLSLRDIGQELNVSYQWVRMHLKEIYKKINK